MGSRSSTIVGLRIDTSSHIYQEKSIGILESRSICWPLRELPTVPEGVGMGALCAVVEAKAVIRHSQYIVGHHLSQEGVHDDWTEFVMGRVGRAPWWSCRNKNIIMVTAIVVRHSFPRVPHVNLCFQHSSSAIWNLFIWKQRRVVVVVRYSICCARRARISSKGPRSGRGGS